MYLPGRHRAGCRAYALLILHMALQLTVLLSPVSHQPFPSAKSDLHVLVQDAVYAREFSDSCAAVVVEAARTCTRRRNNSKTTACDFAAQRDRDVTTRGVLNG